MNFSPFLFEIPAQYLAGVQAGEVVRYGAILKDVSDGKILAHLQQTGVFDHALSHAVSNLGQFAQSSINPVSALTGLGTIAQNQQIKGQLISLTDMVGSLQALNLVGSIASVAGIGVTVASTAILMQRMKTIDTGIGRIEAQIAGLSDQLKEHDIHMALRKVEDTMEKLAEAPFRKSEAGTRKVLGDVEESLRTTLNYLLNSVKMVISYEIVDEELLRTLFAGLATCAAAQSKTLIWLDEVPLAQNRALTHAEKLNDLARLMPRDVIQGKLSGDVDAAARLSTDMRELRAVAASRPTFCARLAALEITGPDYLAHAQERDNTPVLMLPSD